MLIWYYISMKSTVILLTLMLAWSLVSPLAARAAINNLNGLINSTQFLVATTSDANLSLQITSSSPQTHYFKPIWSGALQPARGGTGATSTPANGQLLIGNGSAYTIGNLLQGSDIVITNATGSITIAVTSTPAFTSLTLTNPLASPYGGTGISTYSKGDILVAQDANTLVRLPAGSDGQVLMASSTAALGVAWVSFNRAFKFEISDGSVKALYHLEDTSDSAGSNTLTNTGGVTFASGGKFGSGADFGNPNSTKRLNNAGYTQVGSTTISAWYRLFSLPAPGKNALIANVGEGTGTFVYHAIYIDSNGTLTFLRQKQNVGGSGEITTTTVSADRLPHHVVYKYDASNSTLQGFLDGVSVGTTNTSGSGASGYTGGIDIGGAGGDLLGEVGGTLSWMSGIVDDVAIFNKAVDTSTIISVYNGGSGKEICVTVRCGN
jgi:concanavalin A-like lectin/glucanase superfamily protein